MEKWQTLTYVLQALVIACAAYCCWVHRQMYKLEKKWRDDFVDLEQERDKYRCALLQILNEPDSESGWIANDALSEPTEEKL